MSSVFSCAAELFLLTILSHFIDKMESYKNENISQEFDTSNLYSHASIDDEEQEKEEQTLVGVDLLTRAACDVSLQQIPRRSSSCYEKSRPNLRGDHISRQILSPMAKSITENTLGAVPKLPKPETGFTFKNNLAHLSETSINE